MIQSAGWHLIGALAGFTISLGLLTSTVRLAIINWITTNLGYSTLAFGICLVAYLASLLTLKQQLNRRAAYQRVVQLDQLSDVWIHVFIGIGVIWTAIGMRSALVVTLSAPDSLINDAGQVLSRMVEGGILLALSTTIVGAIGGYLMRLFKTLTLGPALTAFYHQENRSGIEATLDKLDRIEQRLAGLSYREQKP